MSFLNRMRVAVLSTVLCLPSAAGAEKVKDYRWNTKAEVCIATSHDLETDTTIHKETDLTRDQCLELIKKAEAVEKEQSPIELE